MKRGLTLLLLLAGPAWADDASPSPSPKAELSLSYSMVSVGVDEDRTESMHGIGASFGYAITRSFSLVADASAHWKTVDGVDLERQYLLGGVRYSLRKKSVTPYVQGLAGMGWSKESVSIFDIEIAVRHSGFAFGGGLGVDVRLADRWALRVGGDILGLSAEDGTEWDPRLTAGVVARFGSRP